MQLTREKITEAAMSILGEYGLGDVSMRRVASSLGVAPGALYWHIANKQELIASMAEMIVRTLIDGSADQPHPHPATLSAQLRDAVLGVRDGAEVVVAAVSQPDATVRAALRERFVESVGAFAGEAASISNVHSAALGLLHLTLGDATVQQSAAQLAELTGVSETDDARQAHEDAVNFLLEGLRARS